MTRTREWLYAWLLLLPAADDDDSVARAAAPDSVRPSSRLRALHAVERAQYPYTPPRDKFCQREPQRLKLRLNVDVFLWVVSKT